MWPVFPRNEEPVCENKLVCLTGTHTQTVCRREMTGQHATKQNLSCTSLVQRDAFRKRSHEEIRKTSVNDTRLQTVGVPCGNKMTQEIRSTHRQCWFCRFQCIKSTKLNKCRTLTSCVSGFSTMHPNFIDCCRVA